MDDNFHERKCVTPVDEGEFTGKVNQSVFHCIEPITLTKQFRFRLPPRVAHTSHLDQK